MPDQTPEPHTDDELREIIEFGGGLVISEMVEQMAAELLDARARIAELEAAQATPVGSDTSDGHHTFAELYRYRMLYNAALFNEWAAAGLYDVHKSIRHSDGELCFGGGWFVVYADLPTGQISNHYEQADWDLFRIPARDRAAEWDGHTPEQAAERLAAFLGLDSAQSEPHAYVAVKRLHSPNATEPEWDSPARVIPAGDFYAEDRDRFQRGGWDLLPIVGTETGTRPAAPARCQATTTGALFNEPDRCIWCELPSGHAGNHDAGIPQPGQPDARVSWPEPAPQADPAGYVVVTRNSEGGVHRSATVWESLDRARAAEGVQAGYADGTGCTAAVYELREVQ